jgi:hypothetical protein
MITTEKFEKGCHVTINRRRAPSSTISRAKKLDGHANEDDYAHLIGGKTLGGTQKSDVRDSSGLLHSVKSGKKWQVFLYGYERISNSKSLKVLKPCLDAFSTNPEDYFVDRIKCIEFKEDYVAKHGRTKAKLLSNEEVSKALGKNLYIQSKENLAKSTSLVCNALEDKMFLREFLTEALFNNQEVDFLAIRDDTYLKDKKFRVFEREEVIEILTQKLEPFVSQAGKVPEDYNVASQKTLLCYKKENGKNKNIVEIEIRNDSSMHYRQVRFNMYSRDTLYLLLKELDRKPSKQLNKLVTAYGSALNKLTK